MTVIVGLSAHGSPGVTTSLTIVASTWSSGTCVLLEGDPVGGCIAARFQLGIEPGLGALASANTQRPGAVSILDHCQELPSGVPVCVAAPSPSTARRQMTLISSLDEIASYSDATILVDLGSVDPSLTSSLDVLRQASTAIWFVRPTAEELTLLVNRLNEVPSPPAAGIVLVGSGPYTQGMVSEAIDIPVVGSIPFDAQASDAANIGGADRYLKRSPLSRACRSLAATVEQMAGLEPIVSDEPAKRSRRRRRNADDEESTHV